MCGTKRWLELDVRVLHSDVLKRESHKREGFCFDKLQAAGCTGTACSVAHTADPWCMDARWGAPRAATSALFPDSMKYTGHNCNHGRYGPRTVATVFAADGECHDHVIEQPRTGRVHRMCIFT